MRPAISVQSGAMAGRDELLGLLRARSLMEGEFVLSSMALALFGMVLPDWSRTAACVTLGDY